MLKQDSLQVCVSSSTKVGFHQGGAPSVWSREFPNAGRLIALGYYVSLSRLEVDDTPAGVAPELWEVTRDIFANRNLTHVVRYRDVRQIEDRLRPLTRDILGRPPRPGENYIIVAAGNASHSQLSRLWAECCVS